MTKQLLGEESQRPTDYENRMQELGQNLDIAFDSQVKNTPDQARKLDFSFWPSREGNLGDALHAERLEAEVGEDKDADMLDRLEKVEGIASVAVRDHGSRGTTGSINCSSLITARK